MHAAIIFQSPNYLVSALLEQYPAAAARKDDQGMLPLHLSFRHKQEDEDLLELLLVKYPKAVMIKDRRDRVPLEHGRESKFSAKIMRLYADAVTAASRLVGGKGAHPPTPSSFFSSSAALTACERTLLEKDHKTDLAQLKSKYEALMQKAKGLSSERVLTLEGDAEMRIGLIRADYEAQIRRLKDLHDERIAGMHESHQSNLNHVEQAAEEAQHALAEHHAEEVNELRLMIDSQVNQDRALSDALEKEIAHLQVALQERRGESDTTGLRNKILEGENENLRDLLNAIREHHVKLQEMLTQQQEGIEASRSIRNQLVQTLMRQDDDDRGVAMIELAEKLRRRIAHTLDDGKQQQQQQQQKLQQQQQQPLASRVERDRIHADRGESRLERERGEHAEKRTVRRLVERGDEEDDDERRDAVAPSRLEQARGDDARDEDNFSAPLKRELEDDEEEEDEYGEVRILADEISAITDTSAY